MWSCMRKKIQPSGRQAQPGEASLLGELPVVERADESLSSASDSASENGECETIRGYPRTGGASGKGRSAADLCRGIPSGVLIGLIRMYQWTISPLLPNCCRFEPSCSHYAIEALRVHGFWRGCSLSLWRLLRCQPFCKGGRDPVPPVRKSPLPANDSNSGERDGTPHLTVQGCKP